MVNVVHPLLTLLASLTRQELAQQVRYLKAENEILGSKLPSRITLDNRERNTLVKHGKKLGGKIKDVMTIVSYSTFRRWVRGIENESPKPTKRPAKKPGGRPKVEEDVHARATASQRNPDSVEVTYGYNDPHFGLACGSLLRRRLPFVLT